MGHRHRLIAALLIAAGLTGLAAHPARADELAAIRHRGTLVVGVKADYPPFGFRTATGEIKGIEPDLAAAVARELGVRLELVPVLASNRIALLQEGRIDLIIATMNDTIERRSAVEIVKPYYYAAGYNVMVPKSMAVAAWSDLKGRTLCGVEGAYYNYQAATNFNLTVTAFATAEKALAALKAGQCAGLLFDDAWIAGGITKPEWIGYDMPLESKEVQPWGLAVRKNEPVWSALLSGMVVKWTKDGTILDLETAYRLKHSAYAEEAHRKASSQPVTEAPVR